MKILNYIPTKKTVLPCLFFSTLLSVTLVVGHSLYTCGTFSNIVASRQTLISNLLTFLGYSIMFTIIFTIIAVIIKKYQQTNSHKTWKIFRYPWIYSGVIFLCWLPCYLSYYPGVISYDMHDQMPQALGTISYSKYHPPLHTFIWDICLALGDILNLNGLVIYSILQMALLSISFTYILSFLIRKKVRNWIILVTLLFICFNPVIAIFSFIPVKDVLFTVFFILYSVELCNFVSDKEDYARNLFAMGRLIVFAVFSCLLRNNMVYALIVATIFMMLFVRKYWKNILLWHAIIVLTFSIINGPIYNALGIKDGDSREMLSIPIQQITYIVAHYEDSFSQEEIQQINEYLPFEDLQRLYNPRLADYAKITFNTENFEDNKSAFFQLWFDLFLKYPDEYIVAFLNLNLPYWYINANTIDEYAKRDYIETYIMESSVTNYEVVRDSKIPWLYEQYELYAQYKFTENTPIISAFFSISTPIWLLLFTATVLIALKRHDCITILAPAICYWMTFMLGPVSNLRYVFPIIALYPLYIALTMDTPKLESRKYKK